MGSIACGSSMHVRLASLTHGAGTSHGFAAAQFSRSRGGTYTVSLRTKLGYDASMSSSFVDCVSVHYKESVSKNSELVCQS